jgi:uncharacterized membrane protein YgcG
MGTGHGWRILAAGLIGVAAAGSDPPGEETPPAAPPAGEVSVPTRTPAPLRQTRPSLVERWRQSWLRCKCNCQACFLGYPEEFEVPPHGASVYAHGNVMVGNGEAARMVLFQYDFVDGQPQLNLRGHDQLMKIAHLLATNPAPLVVERTLCAPGLAEARRLVVLNELARCSGPVPPERVVVGPPIPNGLSGIEAELIYRNFLIQVRTEGSRVIGVTGSGGGFGGGGSAGGGFGGQGGGAGGPGSAGGLGGPGGGEGP